jgi:hypothetical protein
MAPISFSRRKGRVIGGRCGLPRSATFLLAGAEFFSWGLAGTCGEVFSGKSGVLIATFRFGPGERDHTNVGVPEELFRAPGWAFLLALLRFLPPGSLLPSERCGFRSLLYNCANQFAAYRGNCTTLVQISMGLTGA